MALGRPTAREKYQVAGGATILDFAGESLYDAVDLIFANQWNQGTPEDGSDIDIYDYASKTSGTKQTIYWNGGTNRNSGYSLAWGTTANVPRKWFFVKVQEVK